MDPFIFIFIFLKVILQIPYIHQLTLDSEYFLGW